MCGFWKEALRGLTYITTFLFFLAQFYIERVFIPKTNNRIKGSPLSFGEFLHFIGLWILVAFHPGCNRRYFFADKSTGIFEGAPIQL